LPNRFVPKKTLRDVAHRLNPSNTGDSNNYNL
jgi:hypothetical protein